MECLPLGAGQQRHDRAGTQPAGRPTGDQALRFGRRRLDTVRGPAAFPHRIEQARLPRGLRVYAVGDVHGRSDLLAGVLGLIATDLSERPAAEAVEIFVGDYIDRGLDSAGVIELLRQVPSGRERICLKGNHEDTMLRFVETASPLLLEQWLLNGGSATLRSYGVPLPDDIEEDAGATADALRTRMPEPHRVFLQRLALSARRGGTLFVHAGIRPGIAVDRQDPHDLIWIRDEFLSARDAVFEQAMEPRSFVVHGHTPCFEGPELTPWRLNIDTGAFASGQLTCAVLEDDEVDLLPRRRRR